MTGREFVRNAAPGLGESSHDVDSKRLRTDPRRRRRRRRAHPGVGHCSPKAATVCRTLRAGEGAWGLPILLVSGVRTDPLDRATGLLLGGDDYLVKPFEPEELLARVHALMRRARSPGGPPRR
jgi:hypothetical protein